MLKRSLVFTSPTVLTLKNKQLVISFKEVPTEKVTVPIEDIGFVLIDNPLVSITIPLLNALSESNVAVVFCDAKGMPTSMMQNFDNNLLQGENIQNQISATETLKKNLWKQTIESKIKNQTALLNKLGKNGDLLKPYYKNVKSGDSNNREGIAARIYFQELFGKNFTRDRFLSGTNLLLNYGYTIIRSATARAIMSTGLFPAFGIFHHNRSNAFPLADDLMEPYRPFVDEIVFDLQKDHSLELNKASKEKIIRVLFCDTYFPKITRPLEVALSYTMSSVARCFNKEQKIISYPTLK